MSALFVTAFEPFTGVPSNPTMRIIERLPGGVRGRKVETRVLPVDTRAVASPLSRIWASSPAAVLHLGVASPSDGLRLERRAENRLAFGVPDNRGVSVSDAPIEEDGPRHVASRLPIGPIAAQWTRRGVPFTESDSAGTFLCNQVMYLSLRALNPGVPSGFVHVPPDEILATQLGRPTTDAVPLELQVAAVILALETIAEAIDEATSRPYPSV